MSFVRNLSASEVDRVSRRIDRVEAKSPLRNGAMLEGDFLVGGDARIIYEGSQNQPDIQLATPTQSGLMPLGDKQKLDAATPTIVGDALVRRDPQGRFSVPAPSAPSHPLRMAELTALDEETPRIRGTLAAGTSANSLTTSGVHDVAAADTETITNRPSGVTGETMIVVHRSRRGLVSQEWIRCESTVQKWTRTRLITGDTWSAWAPLT